jgi:hypothetical protein
MGYSVHGLAVVAQQHGVQIDIIDKSGRINAVELGRVKMNSTLNAVAAVIFN